MENILKKTINKIFFRNKNFEETTNLNNPDRFWEIKKIIKNKPALCLLYEEVYHKYLNCISHCPSGDILEIGSGAGFAKEIIPQLITSDIISYSGMDKVLDATCMDFADNSLSCICMFNVLHHISDAAAFFKEAYRCLKPNGKIFMVEPYPGWIGAPIYRFLHHEPYDPNIKEWTFESTGPLSDANNALPYVIFERDRIKFQSLFPNFSILQFKTHSPIRYWLTGGLKKWSLLPAWAFNLVTWLDNALIKCSPRFGSFVDIELVKNEHYK